MTTQNTKIITPAYIQENTDGDGLPNTELINNFYTLVKNDLPSFSQFLEIYGVTTLEELVRDKYSRKSVLITLNHNLRSITYAIVNEITEASKGAINKFIDDKPELEVAFGPKLLTHLKNTLSVVHGKNNNLYTPTEFERYALMHVEPTLDRYIQNYEDRAKLKTIDSLSVTIEKLGRFGDSLVSATDKIKKAENELMSFIEALEDVLAQLGIIQDVDIVLFYIGALRKNLLHLSVALTEDSNVTMQDSLEMALGFIKKNTHEFIDVTNIFFSTLENILGADYTGIYIPPHIDIEGRVERTENAVLDLSDALEDIAGYEAEEIVNIIISNQ